MNSAILLTASRIVIAPFFAYFFITGYHSGLEHTSWIWLCFALALLIEVTDLFDGRLARANKQVTDFGKVFDPVADSISRQTIFISFMVVGIIPLWMYLIFFYRDALMQLLRIICASSGVVLAARKSGKLKAVLQGIAAFGVLLVIVLIAYKVISPTWWGFHPAFWVMLLPTAFTFLSMFDYIIPNWKLIKKMMEPKR